MDIKCAKCQEPWDHHHLLADLPQEMWDGVEGSYSMRVVDKFKESPKTSIPKPMREALGEEGWKFGKTIVCILECCCCSEYATLDSQELIGTRQDLRLEAEATLGDDLDGLISTLTSVDMYAEM